jgi:hypothetical protein
MLQDSQGEDDDIERECKQLERVILHRHGLMHEDGDGDRGDSIDTGKRRFIGLLLRKLDR